ncbi:hypothetical protein CesoFtcFv8_019488 [Champsocephalus esox]|uniref:Uncharacterized protein n=1 Tax=Champsocephalus esox TaxID=159716 RepID=A0AAN8BEM9_9TELE|nr:hypothetical protein CesoFtcFv8_019488 [Champsocephalus esox]
MVLCQQYSTSQLIFKGRKQQEAQPLQEERKMNLSLMFNREPLERGERAASGRALTTHMHCLLAPRL